MFPFKNKNEREREKGKQTKTSKILEQWWSTCVSPAGFYSTYIRRLGFLPRPSSETTSGFGVSLLRQFFVGWLEETVMALYIPVMTGDFYAYKCGYYPIKSGLWGGSKWLIIGKGSKL